ncbi:MAG: tRNA pseudouridine(38-40) synthase TruA [Sedimentisphaerales bacterium]|nr:tRNA pseudouridine(38-40) synthase TruA [Sedimentisphaerales bacterium]
MTIQYDGTAYHGWQSQRNADTVQQQISESIERLTTRPVRLFGSSRTDAGVHALGQVAHFHIDCPVPTENFRKALNKILPDDIVITDVTEVAPDFDAIKDTRSKRYRYTICTAKVPPVMQVRFCWHRPGTLNAEAMQTAAACLIGRHDFKSFASAADKRQSSVRTILGSSVQGEGPWIYYEVEADGFLYNMVRNIVGTLVEIGRGRWRVERMQKILAARDRTLAGSLAPACGLCLLEIRYDSDDRIEE